MSEEPPADSEPAGVGESRDAPSAEPASAGTDPLAVVVDERRTEIAIESLRAEGVYDDARAVRPFDDGRTALPVTRPPASTRVDRVVRQVEPDYRPTDLDTLLRERGWNEGDRERAPGSWAVVGDVILVTIPPDCPDERAVADALLELHGGAETVLADDGVSGRFREPRTRHLAGETDTETVHVEHGTEYALDPARVMFSPGNQAERVRMGAVVEPGERVFDMFAGIGYFTLPMARAGANVTATELNPTAFRYLLENAVRNDVTDRIAAYNADCRDLTETVEADRVVMGYYGVATEADAIDDGPIDESAECASAGGPSDGSCAVGADIEWGTAGESVTDDPDGERRHLAAETFLPDALASLRPGGIVHVHAAVADAAPWKAFADRITDAVEASGRTANVLDRRRIKTHSAGVDHAVFDVKIS